MASSLSSIGKLSRTARLGGLHPGFGLSACGSGAPVSSPLGSISAGVPILNADLNSLGKLTSTFSGLDKRNFGVPRRGALTHQRAYSSYKGELEPSSSATDSSPSTPPKPTTQPTSTDPQRGSIHLRKKKTTVGTLQSLRAKNVPITMITAYDFPTAKFADMAGVDVCLVGDSLGMVALGMPTTESVTLDMMVHHSLAVSRGLSPTGPLLLTDMPFGTYESSPQMAIASAVRLIQEGKAEMVKMEGGEDILESIAAVSGKLGASVCGHIGLMPQRAGKLGGFKVQAKTFRSARDLVQTARALQEAGISLLVLECIPPPVAAAVTKLIDVPTIGIGAGVDADGQVLVMGDAMGFIEGGLRPKFAKQYHLASPHIVSALQTYNAEVRAREFPAPQHTYAMESEDDRLEFEEWADGEVRKKQEERKKEDERMAARKKRT